MVLCSVLRKLKVSGSIELLLVTGHAYRYSFPVAVMRWLLPHETFKILCPVRPDLSTVYSILVLIYGIFIFCYMVKGSPYNAVEDHNKGRHG